MVKPIIFARVTTEDYQLLKEVSKARGEGLSNFVRRAVRRELALLSYLSAEEKKALGVKVEREGEKIVLSATPKEA